MNSKLVSIGLPTYRRPDLLSSAIGKLATQTYANLEIHVSDNCSPDIAAFEKIKQKFSQDSRIRFTRQPANLGFLGNIAFLLDQSRGEYFIWVADDDTLDSSFIEKAVEILDRDQDCVMAFSGWRVLDQIANPPIEKSLSKYALQLPNPDKFKRLLNYIWQPEYCGKARILWGLIRTQQLKAAFSEAKTNIGNPADLTTAELPIEFYLLNKGNIGVVPEDLIQFALLPSSEGLREGNLFRNRMSEMCRRSFAAYRIALRSFRLPFWQRSTLLAALKIQEVYALARVSIFYWLQSSSPALARAIKVLWYRVVVRN